MLRLITTTLLPVLFLGLAGYLIWKGLSQAGKTFKNVEFAYVRFRNGVLVLDRITRFGHEEVQFAPSQEFSDLQPLQLAAYAGVVSWFTFPEGHPIQANSEEAQAIDRCLLFASNTGLLQAELSTE